MHNRISEPGRRVRIYPNGREPTIDGWFEAWSRTNHGTPCAIVRLDDGSVMLYMAIHIQFIDVPVEPSLGRELEGE